MAFYKYKESITHKTENFPVAYYNVDFNHPRYEMRHHWHREYELIYVSAGILNLTLDKKAFSLSEGEFALIPPGVIHSGNPHNCKYECVVMDVDFLIKGCKVMEEDMSGLLSRRLSVPPIYRIANGEPEQYMMILVETMRSGKKAGSLAALSAIFGIFYSLIEGGLVSQSEGYFAASQKMRSFENALSFIENNYKEKITLKELAASAGISSKYFGEYFKKLSGKTPFQYLNEYRIERASEMLLTGEKSVTEISLDCGFNDLSYFTKTFKKIKGISPNRYKAQQSGYK